jgi:hypothetical protein
MSVFSDVYGAWAALQKFIARPLTRWLIAAARTFGRT